LPNPKPAPTYISREIKAEALGKVIDKWRMSQGWQPLTDNDLHATIAVWMEAFDAARVEPNAYHELYLSAIQVRGSAIANGQTPPPFAPELFISLWPALKAKRERQDVESGRMLAEVAESQCPLCVGSGFEVAQRPDGYMAARKCPNGCRPRA
jgi:hypothetical protein